MPDGMSPTPDPLRPQDAGHYRADDDIELPPLDDSGSDAADAKQWSTGPSLPQAVVVGGRFYMSGRSAEKQHENWQHVAAAAKASNDSSQQLVRVESSGASFATSSLELSAADVNRAAMQQIRMALLCNDLVSASAALQVAKACKRPSKPRTEATGNAPVAFDGETLILNPKSEVVRTLSPAT